MYAIELQTLYFRLNDIKVKCMYIHILRIRNIIFTISTDSTTSVKSYRIAIKLQSRFNEQ